MTTRLHLVYRQRLQRITQAAQTAVVSAWRDDPDQFVRAAVREVLEAQTRAVSMTDGYLSLEAGLATGTSTEPAGVDPGRVIGRASRGGTPLEDVYYRTVLSPGALRPKLLRTVATDVQLASRNTAWLHTNADPRIVAWRRVLSTGDNCGLCIAASTQRYHKEALQPIHDHCGCTVAPIYGRTRQVIDRDRLNALYGELGQRGVTRAQLGRVHVDASRLPSGVDPATLPPVQVVDDVEFGVRLEAAA